LPALGRDRGFGIFAPDCTAAIGNAAAIGNEDPFFLE
jgi:hypothetical protein